MLAQGVRGVHAHDDSEVCKRGFPGAEEMQTYPLTRALAVTLSDPPVQSPPASSSVGGKEKKKAKICRQQD